MKIVTKKNGIIIACSSKDHILAKGCLASIKHFMPGTPVCLLADGDIPFEEMKEFYPGLQLLNKNNIKNKFLRENSFGWGITKMIAFWESPFDNFLLIDADTCLWGRIDYFNSLSQFDMVIDQPQYKFDTPSVNLWFFDTDKLKSLDPEFDFTPFQERYFCTGAFFAKKNIFDIEWYRQLLPYCNEHTFKYGEMGLLNYMIFKSVQSGKLNVSNQYFQFIAPDFTNKYTRKIFPFIHGLPSVIKPFIIHYNGNRKPYIQNYMSYHQPMTFFRKSFAHFINPDASKKQITQFLLKEEMPFLKKHSPIQHFKNRFYPYYRPYWNFFKKNILSK